MMFRANAKYCLERLIDEARGPGSFAANVEPETHGIEKSAGEACGLEDVLEE